MPGLFTPILTKQPAFDATKEHAFEFYYEETEQIVRNRLTIHRNSDNRLIYAQYQDSFKLEHILPASTLVNGEYYVARIQVFSLDQSSVESDPVSFYCFSEPVFRFDNIIENQIVKNSAYDFKLYYSQREGEILDLFQIALYNEFRKELYNSGFKSDADLSDMIVGLESNQAYYIRARGQTVQGMMLDTGYIAFSVSYVQPNAFAIVELENQYANGCIRVASNIVSLQGTSNNKNLNYIDGTWVDLSGNDWVVFDDALSFKSDYALALIGKRFEAYNQFLEIRENSLSNRRLALTYMKGVLKENIAEVIEMLIHQAAEECNLTKKAIEYYGAKGLLSPAVLDNGYRDYSEADIHTLKEIAVLRKCAMGVAEIRDVLTSSNPSATLAKYRYVTQIRKDRLQAAQRYMDDLMDDYNIEKAFDCLPSPDEDTSTIKEKLVFAFPGHYGMFLSLHFGRFLDGTIDTRQKQKAYREIVNYLDGLELQIPPELADFLEEAFSFGEGDGVTRLEHSTHDAMCGMLDHTEEYLTRNRQEIEAYHRFLRSDAYLNSPLAQMKNKLRDFQTQSGYREKLVENMKILSPAYAQYQEKLEAANRRFFRHFPHTEDIYGLDTATKTEGAD